MLEHLGLDFFEVAPELEELLAEGGEGGLVRAEARRERGEGWLVVDLVNSFFPFAIVYWVRLKGVGGGLLTRRHRG